MSNADLPRKFEENVGQSTMKTTIHVIANKRVQAKLNQNLREKRQEITSK